MKMWILRDGEGKICQAYANAQPGRDDLVWCEPDNPELLAFNAG